MGKKSRETKRRKKRDIIEHVRKLKQKLTSRQHLKWVNKVLFIGRGRKYDVRWIKTVRN